MISHQKKIYFIFLIACFISLLGFSANAGILDDYFESKQITVIMGETESLRVSNPTQVKIGNPAILDVVGAGQKELLLAGQSEGETSLVVVDDFGEHNYTVKVFQNDLEKVKERVDFLLQAAGFGELTTQIAEKERKIFISGTVFNSKKDFFESKIASVADKIINLVEYQDDVVSVHIDVEVLEFDKDTFDTLGISWNKSVAFSEGTVGSKAGDLLDPTQFFKVMKDWRTGTLSATLNLLKQRNKVRTLSRPKLVCLSGKEAKLLVGGERPIITGSTTSTTSAGTSTDYEIELKETGLTLTIKPIVKENDEIQVSLQTEIREVDEAAALTLSSTVTTPGFTTRSAETELTVMSGETVFLGGLIQSKRTDKRDSVKGLSSIPLLGALFRNREFKIEDSEVVITLTPTIIKTRPQREDFSMASVNISNTKQTTNALIKEDDPLVDYSNLIQNIINSNVKYPKELNNEKIAGTVKLSLHLQSDGNLLGVVIMHSSGNKSLDELAEHTVKKLSPFPAFPSQVKLKELWVDVPIVYEIEGSI